MPNPAPTSGINPSDLGRVLLAEAEQEQPALDLSQPDSEREPLQRERRTWVKPVPARSSERAVGRASQLSLDLR